MIAFLRGARPHHHLIVFHSSHRFVHAFQKDNTALHYAKEYNHDEIVQLLGVRLKKNSSTRGLHPRMHC